MNKTTYLVEERCANGGKVHWHYVYETDSLRDARGTVRGHRPLKLRIRRRTIREKIIK